MPTPAIDILAAKLGEVCYLPSFILHPLDTAGPAVKALNRELVDLVMGVDPGLGTVPFGIVTDGPDGKMTTLRGTQMPLGSWDEWLADFKAWLDACPLRQGARWERGFHSVSDTLFVGRGEPLVHYMIDEGIKIIEGHSLGGPLATNVGAEAGVDLAILIESPNPGDAAFAAYVNSKIKTVRSYWNPRDKIGSVPFDFNLLPPLLVEHFVAVAPKIIVDPATVKPPLPTSILDPDYIWANHNLTNVRMMMEAAA